MNKSCDGPSELIVSVNGNSSYFGCVSSKETCDFGRSMEIKVSSTEINEFYVVNDDNVTLTLVASKNIGNSNTTTLPWYDSSISKGDNTKGHLTVLNALNILTNDWTNVDYIENYEYNNSGTGYKKLSIVDGNAVITDSSGGNVEVSGKSRARLLTYEEAKAL